jgi:hypothetical protein
MIGSGLHHDGGIATIYVVAVEQSYGRPSGENKT